VLIGRRQLLGPLVATALILIQEKFFSFGGNIDKMILGSVLVAILAFFPQGLAGLAQPFARLWRQDALSKPVNTLKE
jgi:branched-chain amino acid transport system permease protein